jgi:hypothetical protein
MRQRLAAKVLNQGLEGVREYRGSTLRNAARRMRRRKVWGPPPFSRVLPAYIAAALTATFMERFNCSIHAVRFGLEGGAFNQRMKNLEQ